MDIETLTLAGATPGVEHRLQVHRYGQRGAGPKAYIQAALHADEIPPLLVAAQLRERLAELDRAGLVRGEVLLLPWANPLGLAQQVLGQHQGRFDQRDGVNFNRNVPDLADAAAEAVAGRLGDDARANVALVRAALHQALAERPAWHAADSLKKQLLGLALDADIVLDLHCDGEAAVHLYALTPQAATAAELGALLGAQAVLLATESGDSPFDEACSRPWLMLQQRQPQHPLPLACFSATVELRGQADTSHALARQDALAILEFLRRQGVLAGAPAALPAPRCEPTPLAGSEPLVAPVAGVVVFHREPGAHVAAGELVAEVVDVATGRTHALHAQSAGVLYARIATRWATAGDRLAKIAGTRLQRSGKLLSP